MVSTEQRMGGGDPQRIFHRKREVQSGGGGGGAGHEDPKVSSTGSHPEGFIARDREEVGKEWAKVGTALLRVQE